VFSTIEEQEKQMLFLRAALVEAERCQPTPTAFCVGCVITAESCTSKEPVILATGYSRELAGNTHAEANALSKLTALPASDLSALVGSEERVDQVLSRADVYTTMEPCSVRTSGLAPCADALIKAGVKRCFIGVGEPDDFVNCEGAKKLIDVGIEVVWMKGMEEQCLKVARRGH
jgi:pyrimidine deaminase RibD-like protein